MLEKYTSEQLKEMKERFTDIQLICCTASRQFKDREVVFGGVGNSFLVVAVAKLVHTPNIILETEAGYVGFAGVSSMTSPADNHGGIGATLHQGLFEMFRDMQAGLTDAACLGFAQMDRFGNANVTYVMPDVRMNGSGGGGDISSSAGRVVYIARFSPRAFKDPVDYVTNPGYLDGGPGAREKANLVGGGPECVVTDRGIFRFDEETREIYLAEVFPWQDESDIDEIKSAIPWDLKIADSPGVIEPPSEAELEAIVLMDPGKQYQIDSFTERPMGKVFLSGRNDLWAYQEVSEIYRETMQKAKDRIL
ncbi:MAG: glutaconate CoA-transferase [Proteobacteria bacterium]|nr:glutaconate CoA-transferase [Pseudomonadota bacterium]